MRLAWRRLALMAGVSLLTQPSLASDAVRCWRVVTSSSGGLTTDLSAEDLACPVHVAFTEFSGTFAPGDDVPVMWNVLLKPVEFTTNDIKMPLPPVATLPRDGDPATAQPTQISATYVRTCSGGVDTCDPSTTATTFTPTQSGNFSSSVDFVQFSSLKGLKFDAEGTYTIAAMAAIRDAVDASTAYVFAGYTTVNITGSSTASSNTTTPHEKGVVRCRMSRQSALNETLDASTSVSESTNCEVGIKLVPLEVTRPEAAVVVAWTATLNQRDDADIHMPSPLSSEVINGTSYEIVRSSLSLCKSEKLCDEYTAADDMQEVLLTGPASFSSANKVSFVAPPVALPSAGWHVAMIHLVVAGPSRRYDFVYYLELLATETDLAQTVDTATYVADTNTSYCWQVLADGTEANVSSSSVAAAAQDTECPYTSSLSVETITVIENGTVDLSWTVLQREAFSLTKFDSVKLTSVYDSASQTSVSLPGLHLYVCSVGTVCTPFSSSKTLVFSASARDMASDGKAIINASGVKFSGSPGNYTLMAHTVFPNGANRVDTASYATVTVSAASAVAAPVESSSKSHTLMYVLVSVGSIVGVVVIFFAVVWFRKRRHRQNMEKIVRFGVFGAPARPPTMLKTTESKSSGSGSGSDPFGHGGGSFSLTRAEPSPLSFSEDRDGSLSYNPYIRTSFQDMSLQESNLSFAFSDSERPSVSSEAYDV